MRVKWKVVDGKTREQSILTGERRAEGIEILNGLIAGDVILLHGSEGMPAQMSATDDRRN